MGPTLCSHSGLGFFTLTAQLHEKHTYFLSGLFLQQPDPRLTPSVQISGLGGDSACLGCLSPAAGVNSVMGPECPPRGGPGGHAGQLCSWLFYQLCTFEIHSLIHVMINFMRNVL